MELKPKTRAQAILQGGRYYWPDTACKHGHMAARAVANYSCQECQRLLKSAYYDKNKYSFLERCKQYYAATRATRLKVVADYYERNKAICKENVAKWAASNPTKVTLTKQKYREQNRDKLRSANKRRYLADRSKSFANSAAARARKRTAIPSWADRIAIKKIYAESRRLTELTGIKHSVDHIYPLAGKTVSGLHVHTNLQILTLQENIKKSSRHPDGL